MCKVKSTWFFIKTSRRWKPPSFSLSRGVVVYTHTYMYLEDILTTNISPRPIVSNNLKDSFSCKLFLPGECSLYKNTPTPNTINSTHKYLVKG